MSLPKTFGEAIDPAKYAAQLADAVEACRANLEAFEKELKKGPETRVVNRHRASLNLKNARQAEAARLKATKSSQAYAAAQNLADAIQTRIFTRLVSPIATTTIHGNTMRTFLLSIVDDRYLELAKTLPFDEALPPALRASLQVEAFRAVHPFVKRFLEICADKDIRSAWNALGTPAMLTDGKTNGFTFQRAVPYQYAWSLFVSTIDAPFHSCLLLFNHILPNRWIRRRLAEDFGFIDLAAKTTLLDHNSLQALESVDSSPEKQDMTCSLELIQEASKTVLEKSYWMVFALAENRWSYLEHSKRVAVKETATTMKPVIGTSNPVWRTLMQVYGLLSAGSPHFEDKGDENYFSFFGRLGQLVYSMLAAMAPEVWNRERVEGLGDLETLALSKKFGVEADIECCDECRVAKAPKDFKRCSRCKVAKYCSANCQKENWKAHKEFCIPRD